MESYSHRTLTIVGPATKFPVDQIAGTSPVMPSMLVRFSEDWNSLLRLYNGPFSEWHKELKEILLTQWSAELHRLPFDELSPSDQVDWLLLRRLLDTHTMELDFEFQQYCEVLDLLPFGPTLVGLEEDRQRKIFVMAECIAETLTSAEISVLAASAGLKSLGDKIRPSQVAGARSYVDRLLEMLKTWFEFFDLYDPEFHWWVSRPMEALTTALTEYRDLLSSHSADLPLMTPLGRDEIERRLVDAMIYYSASDLLEVGRRELDWTEMELIKASRELGFGDRWREAIDWVKLDHLPPGEQPSFVAMLAEEAIEFVESNDLVTVPALAKTCWQMDMMSAEKQKVNPFFLGGETVVLSFPTSDMAHVQKKMSQRGNNRAFTRATLYHELIPGHHLQGFSQDRHRPERKIFYTPFWVEGWTLHWEMLMWELGFARTPEERIGMLFWRRHRAARIVFSIRYHLGEMSAGECIDYLVDSACHERSNAEAEVRRSFEGNYDPLYQLAYLIGGLQVHKLYHELTGNGTMTPKQFHDSFLSLNCMPIVLVRALLAGHRIERDAPMHWNFLG